MIRCILTTLVMFVCLLLPFAASAGTYEDFIAAKQKATEAAPVERKTIPVVADTLAMQLDAQLRQRLDLDEGDVEGYDVIVTTPVALNDLEETSSLARQMGEELSRWFVTSGYKVQEIRKGRSVLFEPRGGEFVLSRRTHVLANENVRATIIVAGTYTQTLNRVRFNMRFIHAPTNEVLAMATQTLPLNAEMRLLTVGSNDKRGIVPSVGTTF
ncbi:FlgO family outer membrane protein [Halodesulfovibrio aestuarii]|uniref:FlgO family outer membrane protein n=1 Tax=Halodesulfovibrio aestuarii TaxID=126333 RepID=A0A8G2C732_9BACT|nr:FlgO family outer membrane protein [Halodesulfovibrio aestuarii]SHI56237.1 hypothetical protein SAMN05660830_00313 [Halodesulfovibrio aestuarii]